MKQQIMMDNTNNSSTSSSSSSSSCSWQELMGSDLLLKTLHHHRNSSGYETETTHNTNTTTTTTTKENTNDTHDDNNDIHSVQLHDIVRIDFIGYYCNDTTKQQLFSLLPYHHQKNNDTSNHNDIDSSNDSNDINSKNTTTTDTTTANNNDNNINDKLQLLFNTLPIFQKETNILCCIGDKDVIPALEMGLRFMYLHDTSIIYSHSKYAYGISTRTYTNNNNTNSNTTNTTSTFTLPSQSNVIYQVTIHEIIHSTSDTIQKYNHPLLQIQLCHSKKRLANDIYKNDILEPNRKNHNDNTNNHHDDNNNNNNTYNNNTYNKHRAIHIYQRIIERLDNLIIELQQQEQQELEDNNESNNDESNNNMNHENDNTTIQRTKDLIKQAQQIQIDCYNNISAVYMKCHLYHMAKETCVQHIIANRDPHNIKALYRIAKASIYDPSSSYHEVQATIQALQEELNYMIQQQQQQQQQKEQQSITTSDDTNDDTTNNNNNNNNNNQIVAINQLQIDIHKLKKEYKVHVTKYKQQQHIISTNIAKKLNTTITSIANNKNNNNITKTKEQSPATKSIDVSSERDNIDDVVSKNNSRRKMYLYTIIMSILVFIGLLYTIMYYFIKLHSSTTTIRTNKVSNESKLNEL